MYIYHTVKPDRLMPTPFHFLSITVSSLPIVESYLKSRTDPLPIAIWDLDARFQLAPGIHEAPFVLPVLVALVVDDLPGLVEGFEPIRRLQISMDNLREYRRGMQGNPYQKYSVPFSSA